MEPSRSVPTATLDTALAQIEEGNYLAELTAAGAAPVHRFAVAFDGKRVWVRSAQGPLTKPGSRRRKRS